MPVFNVHVTETVNKQQRNTDLAADFFYMMFSLFVSLKGDQQHGAAASVHYMYLSSVKPEI